MDRRILGTAAGLTAAVCAAGGVYLSMPAAAAPAGADSALTAASGRQSAKPEHKRAGQRHARHLRRLGGLHGEATVRRHKEFVRIGYQRGSVTEASAGAVTVRSADGTTWRWTLSNDTRVRRHGEKSAADKIAKGDRVFIAGSPDERQAKLVAVPKKPQKD